MTHTTTTPPPTTTPDARDPGVLRARLPADVEAPDRILGDLTARQVAVLAVTAAVGYLAWRALHTHVPAGVLVAAAVPAAGAAVGLAVGRRDGLGLDAWLAHAVRYARAPHRLLPVRVPPLPPWTPAAPRPPRFGLLRLPADALDADGTVRTGPRTAVALVAVSTLNTSHRSTTDQARLVTGFARWLNGLTTPAQVVVSTRRVNLARHAVAIADTAHLLTGPALTGAALDYAQFLLDLAADRDPLARTVTIAATATGPDAATTAHRTGEQTATALRALGATTSVLDGPAATALLVGASDPFQPCDTSWPRTINSTPIWAAHPGGQP